MRNILLILSCLLLAACLAACGDSEKAEAVPMTTRVLKAHLTACSTKTVSQLIDVIIANPSWRSFKSEKGEVVEVSGITKLDDSGDNLVFQFMSNTDGNGFNASYFGINGKAQSKHITSLTFNSACGK